MLRDVSRLPDVRRVPNPSRVARYAFNPSRFPSLARAVHQLGAGASEYGCEAIRTL